jgi:hypothetical protein
MATVKKNPPTTITADQTTDSSLPQVPSAPAVPIAVAKQYGVHSAASPTTLPAAHATEAPLIDNSETDAAVDAIVAQDSDALLDRQSATAAGAMPPYRKRGFWHRIGHFFTSWWRNAWARYITMAVIAGAIGAAAAIPNVRYYVLNTAGVRSSASVVVLDTTTRTPLKNVTVSLNDQTVTTDINGKASLHDLRLGPTTLHIKRVAFAPYDVGVTIGWGSNPLGSFKMQATGVQYTLQLTDYLSGKPLGAVEAVSDEANALSDRNGRLVLTVADTEQTTLQVTLAKDGYRSETLTLNAEQTTAPSVALVPGQKHVFLERQNNRYDVYAIDVDGKNKQLVLAGTGNESSNISIAANESGTLAAVVSTRDGLRDSDGFVVSALTLVDLASGKATMLDHGAQVQLLGWDGDRLIYRTGVAGASAANSQRYRLMVYNTESAGRLQLASANQFTASQLIGGYVYYAASSNDPKASMGLFRIRTDGAGKERLLQGEVWTVYRNTYATLLVQTPGDWYAYDINAKSAAKTTAPSVFDERLYTTMPGGKKAAWVDSGSAITTLRMHDVASGKDKRLMAHDGISAPLHWLGTTALVYRVATQTETADYAISPTGGQPHKISDVTISYGTISD